MAQGKAIIVQELQARLRLFRSTNIGAVAFHQFIQHYGSAVQVLDNLPELYRGKKITLMQAEQIAQEWQEVSELGGKFLFYGQDDYPSILKNLPDAPPVLTILGNEKLLQGNIVAMVGARNASINGRKMAFQMAEDFATADYNVVTGFARGIDGEAHKAALAHARAIGVLAGGVAHIYPPQHEALYHETLKYGAIISEMPLHYQATASAFPRRNRIIAGLARAVIVVEAAVKSGSLITADYAQKYARVLCALPGSPMDGRAQGANRLIKAGAHLVENAEDVMNLLHGQSELFENDAEFDEQLQLDFSSDMTQQASHALLEGLSSSPHHIDDIIRILALPPANINAALLLLELQGKILRLPGNKFSLT